MKIIKVSIERESQTYNIVVGNNILNRLHSFLTKLDLGDTSYIITNPFLKEYYEDNLKQAFKNIKIKFKIVPPGEKAKSIKYVAEILRELVLFGKGKNIFLTAFGGGVVGDLTGFVASVYKRGVPYINLPTTFLAQVDSAIGGKTAIDLAEAKNMIGTFYQPCLVLSEISLLKSLDNKELRNGISEVIKYGLIKDEELFFFLEKNYSLILNKDTKTLECIVSRASEIKAKIVQEDEKEIKGIRTILNFGHTLGHAIESAGNYKKYSHGEAIALGILLELELSRELGLLKEETKNRIQSLIFSLGLPTKIKGIPLEKIIRAYYYDKKFKGKINRFVLLKKIAEPLIVENIPLKIIRKILKKYSE